MTVTRWTAAEEKFQQNLTDPEDPDTTSVAAGPMGLDIAASIHLGGTRHLWLFGDTFWATAAGQSRATAAAQISQLHSTVALQDGNDLSSCTLTYYSGNTAAIPHPFFRQPAQQGQAMFRYPMCGVRLDEGVLVLGMSHVRKTGGRFGTVPVGPWGVMLYGDIDGAAPSTWQHQECRLRWPRPPSGERSGWQFQAGAWDPGDGWVYVGCQGSWSKSGEEGSGTGEIAVCRFDREQVIACDMTEPYWWLGGGRWGRDLLDPAGVPVRTRVNVAPDGMESDQGGAIHLRNDGQVQLTEIPQDFLSDNPRVSYALGGADSRGGFAGPFGDFTELYEVPVPESDQFAYSAYHHEGQSWSGIPDDGQVITYNHSRNDVTVLADATQYWVHVLQVTDI